MKRNPYLRVKLKSLAIEAAIIRREEQVANKSNSYDTQNQLRIHRVGKVRRASRETLLAYQYLRGVPYAACEKPKSKPVDIKAIEKMCKDYGILDQSITDWMEGETRLKLAA
jgi:hypothetical protein|tara:strand:- start:7 stop:342 length:336 start_codon:yes stop_codon:yes gene_type:complete